MPLNNEHLAFGSWDILSKNILKCLFSFVFLKSPLQVHIVQSTGRITYVQLLSMLFSLFTLSINASRAFYIQRGKEEADPAPSPHMILKVFPFMLIQVIQI